MTNIVKICDFPRENKVKMDNDPTIIAIKTFEKQPNMKRHKMKRHIHPNSVFSFDYVFKEEVEEVIRPLNESKASLEKDISVKMRCFA